MAEVYKEVYVQDEDNSLVEIQPEYVFMTIPAEYVCIYHKLLVYLSDFGLELLADCKASCSAKNKSIIDCWNMFQSMIACHNLGQTDKAEVFKKYIEAQLDIYYKGSEKVVYNGGMVYPITPDGHIKANVDCSNNIKFKIDPETGKLYQEYLDHRGDGKVYTIDNSNLIVESESKL